MLLNVNGTKKWTQKHKGIFLEEKWNVLNGKKLIVIHVSYQWVFWIEKAGKKRWQSEIEVEKNVTIIKDEDRMITIEMKLDKDFKIPSGKVREGDCRDSKS